MSETEFKNYISLYVFEDIVYFPYEKSNENEVIELLNLLSCNIQGGGSDEKYTNKCYHLNMCGVSKNDIAGLLHEGTLKFIIDADDNNYTQYVKDDYYYRLIQFKNSDKYGLLKQMDDNNDTQRFKIKNSIMRWVMRGGVINPLYE